VRPVLDFDAADTEFRDEVDVLADLDNRPNLATMPAERYESLLADLFGVMGLQMGAVTSTDAGARWTALDPRPIFGGKVVVYAVRAACVGAAAAHSLAGAVAAAGASKGILVTTGGFEPAAHEAVAGRPLELIDGSALLHLLSEHLQTKARIDTHTVS
jgi:restriction system protein